MLHVLGLICTALGALVLALLVLVALAGVALFGLAAVRRVPLNISRTFAGGTLEVHTWRDGPRVTVARLRELTSCYGTARGSSEAGQAAGAGDRDQTATGQTTGGDLAGTNNGYRIAPQRTRHTYQPTTKDAEK